MEINTNYIRELAWKEGLTGAELARKMNISVSEANRVLNGERKGGRKAISGVTIAFPEADLSQLFILPNTEPKSSKTLMFDSIAPNIPYVKKLLKSYGWSGSDLARHMGVSVTEANRLLRGARCGGKKALGGLLKAFPEEKWEDLFLLSGSKNPDYEKEVRCDAECNKRCR